MNVMTIKQEVEAKELSCKTEADWKEACEWIQEKAMNSKKALDDLKECTKEVYGEKRYQKIMDRAKEILATPRQTNLRFEHDEERLMQYGYQKEDCMLIYPKEASAAYKMGLKIMKLNPDNTSTEIKHEQEIWDYDGYLGIPYTEIEKMQEGRENE